MFPKIIISYPLNWRPIRRKKYVGNSTQHLPDGSVERMYTSEGGLRELTYQYMPSEVGLVTVHDNDLFTPAVVTVIANDTTVDNHELVISHSVKEKASFPDLVILCKQEIHLMCHNTKVYSAHISDKNSSWYEVERDCQKRGGHLLSINSEREWGSILFWRYRLKELMYVRRKQNLKTIWSQNTVSAT